jgi:putative DNA primase/helicase
VEGILKSEQKPKSAGDPLFYGRAQPEVRHGARFATAKPEQDDGEVLLERAEPYSIARKFVQRKYFGHGALGLYYKGEQFWRFNGSCYEELEFDVLSAEVYTFIDGAQCRYRGSPIPMVVKPDEVNNVIKCIKAGVTIPAKLAQPCWIKTEQPAPELFAFKNMLVNVRTGETLDPTPELWITDVVNFDYNPNAECPRWERFLEEAHPRDSEAQNCIEEQLGLGMTYDMHFEKIAAWFGKSRAGKSTILHVQKMLTGTRAFAPMSFNDWMRSEKSRENLIGKRSWRSRTLA